MEFSIAVAVVVGRKVGGSWKRWRKIKAVRMRGLILQRKIAQKGARERSSDNGGKKRGSYSPRLEMAAVVYLGW